MLLQSLTLTPSAIPRDSVKQVTRDIISQIQNDPNSFFSSIGRSMLDFSLRVVVALIIYIVGIWLLRWIKRGMKRYFEKRHTEQTLASFITSFVSISVTVLLIVISVSTVGIDTTSVAALLAAGGLAIGMSLSGTMQNFAGGVMLLAFQPFKAGDFIEAQGFSGTVVEVNITATKILTPDNRVIILPNGALSNGSINNISGRPLRRVEWLVSVSYGVDAEECKQAILALLAAHPRILQANTNMRALYRELNVSKYQLSSVNYQLKSIPAPFCALKSLNENDITFVVRAWVRSADYWDVFFDMQQQFYTELPKKGFTFAYPHVEIVQPES